LQKYKYFKSLISITSDPRWLAALVLAAALLTGPLAAADEHNASDAPAQQPQDSIIGTGSETIFIGKDPETGNNVIQVKPVEGNRTETEQPIGPIEVRPEVDWTPQKNGGGTIYYQPGSDSE